MHPPSIYSFVTSKRFLPIFIVIVFVLGIIFYGALSISPSQPKNLQNLLSPTPVAGGWKKYKNDNQDYAIQYPANFHEEVASTGIKTFSFDESGKIYHFVVFPPGTGSVGIQGYAQHVDTMQHTTITYTGKQF